jgi:hypothetical protein
MPPVVIDVGSVKGKYPFREKLRVVGTDILKLSAVEENVCRDLIQHLVVAKGRTNFAQRTPTG